MEGSGAEYDGKILAPLAGAQRPAASTRMQGTSVPKDAGQQAVPGMAGSSHPSPLEVPDGVRGS